jgi:hypothetical protein
VRDILRRRETERQEQGVCVCGGRERERKGGMKGGIEREREGRREGRDRAIPFFFFLVLRACKCTAVGVTVYIMKNIKK